VIRNGVKRDNCGLLEGIVRHSSRAAEETHETRKDSWKPIRYSNRVPSGLKSRSPM
jgi:hypothetical protein